QATIGMGEAILIETSLSYLGFGVQEPTPSWGNMVQAGANYFFQGKFWPSTAPALAILFTILGFHLLGDGLNGILEGRAGKQWARRFSRSRTCAPTSTLGASGHSFAQWMA